MPNGSGYLSTDTIAALASAVGGAVAIIRISGPESFTVLEKLSGLAVTESWVPGKLRRAGLRAASGKALDDALLVYFKTPQSYTGEDLVELHIHGGAFTATEILRGLQEYGVRQALPGEFSFRAVRNGKMDLSQAQAVADLIAASNSQAVSLALEKLEGTQSRFVRELAEDLRRLCVLAEAGIDFSDQNLEEVSLPSLKKKLAAPRESLRKLQGSYDRGAKIQDGVRTAFIGLPNAGKSSFFNALLGEDRAIVSEIPGTTRDVLREKMTLQGKQGTVTLRLEDTAGLRDAAENQIDKIEKIGMGLSERSAREADLVLLLLDISGPLSSVADVFKVWKALGGPGGPNGLSEKTIGVFTKMDRVNGRDLEPWEKALEPLKISLWLKTSALTGAGIAAAAREIAERAHHLIQRNPGEVLITRLDQLHSVNQALDDLRRAEEASEEDLFAADIRQALHALSSVIGETVPDDILGRIFSEFCIGK